MGEAFMNPKALEIVSLKGRVAVISGAASGIGLGSARRLAEFGAGVVLLDVHGEKGIAAAAGIVARGGRALFISCDVRSEADCRRAVGETIREFGRIDILFNNAGVIVRKNAIELKEEEWDLMLDVMLKGTYLLSRHVIPHMIAAGGGSIINMGSGWALKGGPDAVAYCAAKGGILNITRAMAIDHGRHGIRVNCVCPGDIDTPLLRSECAQLGQEEAAFMAAAALRPLARVGTPEDVANVVLFFASDLSKWVTGAFLVVDGGGIA
jgi:NAD(P)-dependent dehydrogenase (short-subunit alcohol dehydrogenase family)